MKHVKPRKKPVWLLYGLAVLSVILAVFALVKLVLIPVFSGDENKDPSGQQQEEHVNGDGTGQGGKITPEEADVQRAALLEQANQLIRGYYYDDAMTLLQDCGALQNEETDAKLAECQQLKDSLVKYDGSQYYHVFFHSLIVDTSKAFDGDHMEEGYNMYMTTVSEFKKMLPLLLENDFILYDITEMVELVDGKAVAKDIYLPAGKKPLVLSIDDVNYYDYMKPDGFADRLDVDAEGNVVTIVKDENGNDTVTYDGDVMPILDAFVKEHPEFSWQGAKGIVAVTGYQGAFGYRITDLPDYDEATQQWMLSQVKKVATALRNSGWQIASHSYTHNQYWNNKTMTMEQLEYDTGRWLNEIAPYVGDTNIIITPFGVTYDQDDPRFRYIIDHGFYIYCPVGSDMTTSWQSDNMMQYRLNLDGITMVCYPQRVSKYFFDPALVVDPSRPPLNY